MVEAMILTPNPGDVLCGKGRRCFEHEGNQRFRALIASHLQQYIDSSSRKSKMRLVSWLATKVMESGSRFLIIRSTLQGHEYWVDGGIKKAKDKVGHTIRDALNQKCKVVQVLHRELQQQRKVKSGGKISRPKRTNKKTSKTMSVAARSTPFSLYEKALSNTSSKSQFAARAAAPPRSTEKRTDVSVVLDETPPAETKERETEADIIPLPLKISDTWCQSGTFWPIEPEAEWTGTDSAPCWSKQDSTDCLLDYDCFLGESECDFPEREMPSPKQRSKSCLICGKHLDQVTLLPLNPNGPKSTSSPWNFLKPRVSLGRVHLRSSGHPKKALLEQGGIVTSFSVSDQSIGHSEQPEAVH